MDCAAVAVSGVRGGDRWPTPLCPDTSSIREAALVDDFSPVWARAGRYVAIRSACAQADSKNNVSCLERAGYPDDAVP